MFSGEHDGFVRLVLETEVSARGMMERLAAIEATMVRTSRTGMGRRPTVHLAPELDTLQRRAVKLFLRRSRKMARVCSANMTR